MIKEITEIFESKPGDLREYGPLQLAFLGDSVYEIIIRTLLTGSGDKADRMSRRKTELVRAGTQAEIISWLEENHCLTENEEAVYRRGRNANPHTMAKSASRQEYHRATGFESLLGYLYLGGEEKRAVSLVYQGLEGTGRSIR